MLLYQWATILSPEGGGSPFFVAVKLFISTKLGRALKILNITCVYRTVLEVNYLFHTESHREHVLLTK